MDVCRYEQTKAPVKPTSARPTLNLHFLFASNYNFTYLCSYNTISTFIYIKFN